MTKRTTQLASYSPPPLTVRVIMPLEIQGTQFLTIADLLEELDISRQTLWRWRTEGHVPAGRRYRSGEVLFTSEEASRIRDYAHHVEPIDTSPRDQLRLFNGTAERRTQ